MNCYKLKLGDAVFLHGEIRFNCRYWRKKEAFVFEEPYGNNIFVKSDTAISKLFLAMYGYL